RHELVDHALIQDRRNDVFRTAERLEPLDARKRFGKHRDDPDPRVVFLQAPSQTRDRAARANAGDDVREPATGLLENFLGGRLVVRSPVVVVAVLIAMEVLLRIALRTAGDLA